jgi:hypothetical protein
MSNTTTAEMTAEKAIESICEERSIALSEDQFEAAVTILKSDIAAHSARVQSWIDAGIEYSESAATCNLTGKAKAAIREAMSI